MTMDALKTIETEILPPGIYPKEVIMNVHRDVNVVCSGGKKMEAIQLSIIRNLFMILKQ